MVRRTAFMLAAALLLAGGPHAQAPVKLGLILDMSGVYADITGAGSELAAHMAVEDFGGTVLGRPIEVVVADHQNKPDIAAAVASRWYDSEGVQAVLEVVASTPALAVMNVAAQRNRIVLLSAPAASSITGEGCTPTTIHWAYNTYALAHTTGQAVLQQGGRSWFFIAADYTFGQQLEADTAAVVKAAGGQVLGDARAPLATSDFSSYLLQARDSHAQVVALANAGADLINAAKQAAEFGLMRGGQRVAGLLVFENDVKSLGLPAAQGLPVATAFYWYLNDATRAFSRRFLARIGEMPNMAQAGVYSATLHYLRAVQAAGTLDTGPVLERMRATPVRDFFAPDGRIREDNMMVHPMHLFQVKTPAESTGPWDLYKLVATVPADQAFRPLSESNCPLMQHQ
jgi:branched-chain amino acid transport system substrate-binding protein